MSIRKVVAGLLITAGIAIMAVPFFWRATGEKQTEQLISEFEQTLEDDYDEETDVEEEQTSISEEDEAILKEGGVIGIIETQEWFYYEQDGMVVTLGNWLNGRLSCEQIEQLWCELIIPEQNKEQKESEE